MTAARRRLDWWGLRATPVVFAAVMAAGVGAAPIDLFGFWPGWVNLALFGLAAVAMLGTAAHPDERGRAMAVLCALLATLSRGVTILVVDQPLLPLIQQTVEVTLRAILRDPGEQHHVLPDVLDLRPGQ